MKRKPRRNRKRAETASRNVYIVSLGCPKNLVDTEVITASLLTTGFNLTAEPENASLYLINSCAFILPARKETETAIEEAIAWKNERPEMRRIIISGCLIQWDKKKIYREKYPEVDLWTGIDLVEAIGEVAGKLFNEQPIAQRLLDEVPTYLYDENTPRLQLTMPHVAYLKISDGCSNRCAYCSIPDIRGDLRSRRVDSVVKEAENLRRNGVTELILIAQDSSAFGNDRAGAVDNLPELLRRLDQLDDGAYWIRILYTHPASFSDDLIDAIAESEHVVPYVDIPLQHIADPILKNMRRKSDGAQIRELLAKLRHRIPAIGLRTTFITGFPGETEEYFQELYDFIKEIKFDRLGVFAYCDEPGTPAVKFADKIPPAIGVARRDALMAMQKKISLKLNKSLVGSELDVIVDIIEDDSLALGRRVIDAPEIDNEVIIRHDGNIASGDIIRVMVAEAEAYALVADVV